jgi:hypothetical protein
MRSSLALGRPVQAGDVLLELDDRGQLLRLKPRRPRVWPGCRRARGAARRDGRRWWRPAAEQQAAAAAAAGSAWRAVARRRRSSVSHRPRTPAGSRGPAAAWPRWTPCARAARRAARRGARGAGGRPAPPTTPRRRGRGSRCAVAHRCLKGQLADAGHRCPRRCRPASHGWSPRSNACACARRSTARSATCGAAPGQRGSPKASAWPRCCRAATCAWSPTSPRGRARPRAPGPDGAAAARRLPVGAVRQPGRHRHSEVAGEVRDGLVRVDWRAPQAAGAEAPRAAARPARHGRGGSNSVAPAVLLLRMGRSVASPAPALWRRAVTAPSDRRGRALAGARGRADLVDGLRPGGAEVPARRPRHPGQLRPPARRPARPTSTAPRSTRSRTWRAARPGAEQVMVPLDHVLLQPTPATLPAIVVVRQRRRRRRISSSSGAASAPGCR